MNKTVYMPLKQRPICGHEIEDLTMMGPEERMFSKTIDGIKYATSIEEGPCLKCNEEQQARLEKEAMLLHKTRGKNGS